MATSEAGICNIALLRIGVTDTIDALTDASDEAKACTVLYAQARDTLLQSFRWPFAQRRATLALLASVEVEGWGYAYALPADFLAARSVWGGSRTGTPVPYALEHSATSGRMLLTDMPDAELHYTAQVTAVGVFPPLFVDALVWALAQDLAMALPVKEGAQVRAKQGYELALSRAMAAALNEQVADEAPESPIIAGRWS